MWCFSKWRSSPVRVEPWLCPFEDKLDLELIGMALGETIGFWFRSGELLFETTVPRRSPFRIVDEAYLGKLQRSIKGRGRTWKVFGSPFVENLKETVLFHGVEKSHHFSYLVVTGDECIEFVSAEPKVTAWPLGYLPEALKQFSSFLTDYAVD
jgi:hypothetical protein